MKILKITLALLFLVFLGLGFVFWRTPLWISQIAESKLRDLGVESRVEVAHLNLRGMDLNVTLLNPYEVAAPSLLVRWDLQNWRRAIPVKVSTDTSDVHIKSHQLELWARAFLLEATYDWKQVILKQVDVELNLQKPLRVQVSARSEALGEQNTFRYQIVLEPQDLEGLSGVKGLRVNAPFRMQGIAELTKSLDLVTRWESESSLRGSLPILEERFVFGLDKMNSELSWSSSQGVTVKSFQAQVDGGVDDLNLRGPFVLKDFIPAKSGSGNVRLRIPFQKKSLLKVFQRLAPDIIKDPQGLLVLHSNFDFKNNEWRVRNRIESDFSSLLLYAIPVSDLKIRSSVVCAYGSAMKCDLDDGPHTITWKSAGEAYPFRDLMISAEVKKARLQGAIRLNWLDSKVESKIFEGTLGDRKDLKAQLEVQGLDVAKMLGVVGMKNLAGEGKMTGDLNLLYSSESGLSIPPSSLRSEGPGKIRYKDPTTDGIPQVIDTLKEFNALLARGQQALVYKALDNFHYKSLLLEARRPRAGALALKLHLVGSNPDLANGQIFDISVPIEGQLENLLVESSFRTLAESETSEEYVKRLRKLIRK